MYARGASYKGHCKCNGVCNPSTCDCKSDDGSIKCSISCSCDCLNSGDAIAIDDDDDDLSIIGAKSARLSTPSSLSLSAGISTTKKSRKAKTPPPALKSCDCDLEEGQDYCTGCSCVDEKGEATCTAACNCKCKAAEEVETLEEADAANLIIAQSGILAEEVANNAARYASLPDFSHSDPDATAAADRQAFFDYLFASNPSADQIAAAIPFARRVRQIVKSSHCVLVVAVVPNVLGWGVFAAHDIAADTTIVPYRGFPLTGSSWASLLHHKNKKFDEYGEGTRYMMSVRLSYKNSAGVIMHYPSSNPIWVNPAPYHQGAVARYINHVSSGANTAVCPWTGDKGAIIGDGSYVVAVRDIVAGEELRFNYGGGVKVALASNKFKIMAIERKPRFDAKCDADLASIIRQFGIDDDSKLPSSWRSVYRSACSINSLADSEALSTYWSLGKQYELTWTPSSSPIPRIGVHTTPLDPPSPPFTSALEQLAVAKHLDPTLYPEFPLLWNDTKAWKARFATIVIAGSGVPKPEQVPYQLMPGIDAVRLEEKEEEDSLRDKFYTPPKVDKWFEKNPEKKHIGTPPSSPSQKTTKKQRLEEPTRTDRPFRQAAAPFRRNSLAASPSFDNLVLDISAVEKFNQVIASRPANAEAISNAARAVAQSAMDLENALYNQQIAFLNHRRSAVQAFWGAIGGDASRLSSFFTRPALSTATPMSIAGSYAENNDDTMQLEDSGRGRRPSK